ncbi:Dor1-like family-domain-containing protein [Amylocarpus encephaloides]|uniref:Conserved oligomeric Golgi complex subunit 8 n=1 Tax=Amylocarpus encephaloides TaxID=45428 RepID=A0A9P7YGN9_9HELO|nr:Dor1-like family-domain-containing protein [Amylocarpus encephaloides]
MADPLYELLIPYFDKPSPRPPPSSPDPTTKAYLSRLSTLPLNSLTTTEPKSLAQTAHSLLLSLQALSKRSHKSIIDSSTHLSTLGTTLPSLAQSTASLRDALPKLDEAAINFSETYNLRVENRNPLLDHRREALLLSRNIDRLSDVLDLPSLLSSAISSSSTTAANTTTASSAATLNYASALDLNAHIKRLHGLYPNSPLITSVSLQAETAMQDMCMNLIAGLRGNSLKLASAMRIISWLRRVAPELDPTPSNSSISTPASLSSSTREGALGSLFLVCRLSNLSQMLSALSPLRDLADQETAKLKHPQEAGTREKNKWEDGQQTERYLKRYIEIFREQSFAIVSMYRSIFPPPAATPEGLRGVVPQGKFDPLQPLPSALGTFPHKLVGMLEDTLRKYLPNVRDKSSRDSLLTQVLYCAGSLGRLGGDFSMMLAFLGDVDGGEDEDEGDEWVEVIRKHRVLAGRLELMVGARDGS